MFSMMKGKFHYLLVLVAVCTLTACKSSNVEMKMSVVGTDYAAVSATVNSPVAGNFYNNGFPTDLRLQDDGTVDIANFPRRFHLLTNEYVSAIETYNNIGGFHTISPIYLPFTGAIDVDALPSWDLEYTKPGSPIQVVDVDLDSPEYGRRFPLEVSMTTKMDS